jgi:nucleoside-diphosphate-sugar epimerase
MIVIFGSSADIGRRLAQRLSSAGLAYRQVSRTIEGAVPADLLTGNGVAQAVSGATVIVSCAHARHTSAILAAAPSNAQLVLMGSAWRYSRIANQRADEVRDAEAIFLASNRRGVMLHSSMIYGGNQENNIRRLLGLIRRTPVIPAPDGGRHMVCPIYIDDVVDCLFAATTRPWTDTHVFGVAGPSLSWKQMVQISANSIGLRRALVPVPSRPIIVALEILRGLGVGILDPDVLRRFSEDVIIPLDRMTGLLSVKPRSFERGILAAVASWRSDGVI